jgi:L-rhamnonate dehydratase
VNGQRIVDVRAWSVSGGADYHDRADGHWIDSRIATPMSRYAPYRKTRRSFGLDVLSTVVVELEATDGTVGIGVSTGGDVAAWIVERHLARFLRDARVGDVERVWDQLFRSTLHYGRRGVALNAISAVDLAMWDLLGRVRGEPVYALLGGAVREDLTCYATGPRPDVARELGFLGGKAPLRHGPEAGQAGIRSTAEQFATWRSEVGDDFWLMLDCWMSLDVPHATRLAHALSEVDLWWIEEPLLPDDYAGYAELRSKLPTPMLLATGEHEATRWGFRLLTDLGCADVLQPDVGWCGGLTELRRIAAAADAAGLAVVPHGSSVYSYHFGLATPNCPVTEFLMMSPEGDEVVPMFAPLLLDEPVPVDGRLRVPDRPGFGVELNRDLLLRRPHLGGDR